MTEQQVDNPVDAEATRLPDLPAATQRPARHLGWLWLLPLAAVFVVAWLIAQSVQHSGTPVSIHFKDGYGLKAGDAVRYRGIPVGQVEALRLSPDLSGIIVKARLQADASEVARAGAQFWIERPRVDLDGARGLETVIGANYIALVPGSGDAQSEFTGLEEAPLMALADSGGLEVLLAAQGKGNLRAGAPISYRQVVVGTILSVDLAKDASSVIARAWIKPRYTSLIRKQTRFWRVSAAHVSAGFSGLSFDVESVRGLLLGGITLATPPDAGPPVAQQARFRLYDEPDSAWRDWQPYLALDKVTSSDQPELLSARLSWQQRSMLSLYWPLDEQRHGWLLPVAGGLLGPADLLQAPDDAVADSAALQVNGDAQPMTDRKIVADGVAWLPASGAWTSWPVDQIRHIKQPQDLLIVSGADTPPRFIAAANIEVAVSADAADQDERWNLSDSVPFDPAWHGAAVMSAADSSLVGLLLIDDSGVHLARLPGSLVSEMDAVK